MLPNAARTEIHHLLDGCFDFGGLNLQSVVAPNANFTGSSFAGVGRVVLLYVGGLHLGGGIMALTLHNPAIYLTLGAAWACGLLARLYSMVADKTSLKDSLPGIVVDTVMALLFLGVTVA